MLACIGDLTVDVIAWPTGVFADKVEEKAKVELYPGGQAANCARFAAGLGVKTLLFARIGKDALGSWAVGELKRKGVRCRVARGRGRTAKTVALVFPGGKRTFLNDPGENTKLSVRDINFRLVEKAEHVHIGGYWALDSLREELPHVLEFARDSGIPNSLSIGWDPQGWTTPRRKRLLKLLDHVDYFFLNESEALALTLQNDYKKACDKLDARVTAVHRGSKGCYVKGEEGIDVSVKKVKVVNPVGAGDAFNASFIQGLIQGRKLEEIASRAAEAARKHISSI